MDSIGLYFSQNNIDFDAIFIAYMKTINPIYMKTALIKTVNYKIPGRGLDEEYDYIRLPIQDKIITNIINAVDVKSHFADVSNIVDAVETLDDHDEDLYAFGFHGRNMIVNNAQDETVLRLQFAEVDKVISNVKDELYRYFRQVYYYSMIGDWNSCYSSLKLLSNAKANIISKNIHTEKDRRSNRVFNIGLYKL